MPALRIKRSASTGFHSARVDAPNVDAAARLALSHRIESRPTPPPAGTSFGPVVVTPPSCDPNVPHHDLDDEARMLPD